MESPSSPGSTPLNNRLRRKKNEVLMSDLVQEIQDYGGDTNEPREDDLIAI